MICRRTSASVPFKAGLFAAALLFSAFVCGSTQDAGNSRLRLIPIVSDQRLEDIQESPSGTRLLTHDRGFAPRLWDPRSMRLLGVLPHSIGQIHQALMSANGEVIGTVSLEEARLWDSRTGRVLSTWKNTELISEGFGRIAISSDGSVAAIGGTQGTVWVAKAPQYRLERIGKLSDLSIRDISISDDGRWLAACSLGPQLLVADLEGGEPNIVSGPAEGAHWVEFSPNHDQLLVTGADNRAHLYSVPNIQPIESWPHFIGDKGTQGNTLMAALFVGPGLSQILVAGENGVMSIYDRQTLAHVRDLTGYSRAIREIRRTPDGLRVATYEDYEGNKYDPLKIWNVETGKEFPFQRAGEGPTAGAFSPDGSVFWVGYDDGRIVRHRLADGAWASNTVGAVNQVAKVQFLGGSGWVAIMPSGSWGNFRISDSRKLDISEIYSTQTNEINVSPSGKYAISPAYRKDSDGDWYHGVWNLSTGKLEWGFWESCTGAFWTGREGEVVAHSLTDVYMFRFPADEPFVRGVFSTDRQIDWIKISPDGSRILTHFSSEKYGGEFGVFDLDREESVGNFRHESYIPEDNVLFLGNAIVIRDASVLSVVRPEDGEELWRATPGKNPEGEFSQFVLEKSQDGTQLYVGALSEVNAVDPLTGNILYTIPIPEDGYRQMRASHTGDLLAVFQMRSVFLIDTAAQKLIATIKRNDLVEDVTFIPDKDRLLVLDRSDQLTIWDIAELRNQSNVEPLGSLVLMRGSESESSELRRDSWLAMDREGRYDASDPNQVDGASYVLEWEGGLEPVDVQQLKALYYEPGLFGKLVGYDLEPLRQVPPRGQIRLFPEVDLQRNAKNPERIEVTVRERDEGGIGRVRVLINGKQILERDGSGYFVVNLAEYRNYMLPAAQLPTGRGNVLSIVAANKRNDLASLPKSLDVGIPSDLATPEVNLYGLFVGAGDYVGSRRDLSAPPYDAMALARAVESTGQRFLPGRVHTTTLTTNEGSTPPTRESILAWFEETAQKATSSDIVFVFLAGHGTSVIGEERGYFFLTAGADPGDVAPAILGVHTISAEDLQTALAKIPASKQVIVLDTCHSGAAAGDIIDSRSVSSDYVRAYEAIKDGAGTWLLAGAAADQLSYESRSVDHGLLTYSLLEAIDQVSREGLRATTSGEAFVDVERWFTYAAQRVESLRNEVGISGVQRPEIKRSGVNKSFDIGVTRDSFRGELGLKPPMPILLMGSFDEDELDPLSLESLVTKSLGESGGFKLWQNVTKHPGAYRVAGQYVQTDDKVSVRLFIQQFDKDSSRRNREVLTIDGLTKDLPDLVARIKAAVETAIRKFELEKSTPREGDDAGSFRVKSR